VRIATDSDLADVSTADAGGFETALNRLHWKAGAVFDAAEALLFQGGDDLAVAQKNGRDVAVIGVDAQDVHTDCGSRTRLRRGPAPVGAERTVLRNVEDVHL